jgi:hypothetical protein
MRSALLFKNMATIAIVCGRLPGHGTSFPGVNTMDTPPDRMRPTRNLKPNSDLRQALRTVPIESSFAAYCEPDHRATSKKSLKANCIFYPSCAENPAVQGGDVERGERSSPKLNSVSAAARCTGG